MASASAGGASCVTNASNIDLSFLPTNTASVVRIWCKMPGSVIAAVEMSGGGGGGATGSRSRMRARFKLPAGERKLARFSPYACAVRSL